MRSKSIAAAVVMAIGIGTGSTTVVAIPAHADPQSDQASQQAEQLDKAFLNAIQQKGVRAKSDQEAIDLAHSTCDLLHRGGSVNDALLHVKNATDWPVDKVTAFAGVAVYAYCRDKTPK
ncbi:DUF732 domain-containing protein [Mycolicibacterium sp. P9-64]|uniref:DUF732 domain-containing protein n=1 Tax=Mycolicibacterium sp. P9-64 TaxID=2024612 RepID=UPI0011ED0BC6|nr:DUF732 domain-containing protein [Mycolicibacterium sp. P9-64]KAA0082378.1 DUF732 domain-containing protein [Mycolicibacterium sp. P9-64]